ncbi:MAG: hypothetical protein AAF843_13285 [Bacteroidota bacterium]
MNKIVKYSSLGLFMIVILGLTACGDDDDGPTLGERQLQALQGSWSINQDADVTFQNTNAPGNWSDFSITFTSNNTVNVSGLPTDIEVDLFQVSSFEITGDQERSFTLTFNGLENEQATVNITDDQMTLSFSLSTNDDKLGARTSAITGVWGFSLTKI